MTAGIVEEQLLLVTASEPPRCFLTRVCRCHGERPCGRLAAAEVIIACRAGCGIVDGAVCAGCLAQMETQPGVVLCRDCDGPATLMVAVPLGGAA